MKIFCEIFQVKESAVPSENILSQELSNPPEVVREEVVETTESIKDNKNPEHVPEEVVREKSPTPSSSSSSSSTSSPSSPSSRQHSDTEEDVTADEPIEPKEDYDDLEQSPAWSWWIQLRRL